MYFVFVSLLMPGSLQQISLADISTNVDNDVYTSDFSSKEVSGLVQALFSESTNRTKLLQKIQNKLPSNIINKE